MKLYKGFFTGLMLAAALTAAAQHTDRFGVSSLDIARDGSSITVIMTVDPSKVELGKDKLLRVTPVLKSNDGEHELRLAPFAVAGTNQYFYTIRGHENEGLVYRAGSKTSADYNESVEWQDWMNSSRLEFDLATSACCGAPVDKEEVPALQLDFVEPPLTATLEYIEPMAVSSKEYKLEGKAYVNFPVNRTEIFPDYMNNPVELRKITSSIDTVKGNPDATIQSITLTGYASPEGPYANNVRLAKGRTEAVRYYVERLYDFPSSTFHSNSVPEDWAGLREAIAKSDLTMRDRMLSFIDSDYPVETRNDKFRSMFPTDYAWLLKNVYPWLRHTDYLIKYTIRHYTDVDEIRRVMKTRPQNLSLDEFHLVAQSYPVGSEEYNEVFDIAVRMYPDEPVANLNAANSAMSRGDLVQAEKFLLKAGDSAGADYARGMLFAKRKDYDRAIEYLRKSGTPKAMRAIEEIEGIINYKGGIKPVMPKD